MNKSPKKLIAENRTPVSYSPGKPARYDMNTNVVECVIHSLPVNYWQRKMVKITERKTKRDLAFFLEEIALQ